MSRDERTVSVPMTELEVDLTRRALSRVYGSGALLEKLSAASERFREPPLYTADEWRVAVSAAVMRLVQCVPVAEPAAFAFVDLSPIIQMAKAKPHCPTEPKVRS